MSDKAIIRELEKLENTVNVMLSYMYGEELEDFDKNASIEDRILRITKVIASIS